MTPARTGTETRTNTSTHTDGGPGRRPAAMREVVEQGRRELEYLTGRPVDSVSSVRRADHGWQLTVELVELERIPASTSVLASYDVQLDPDGSLIGYERVRRYYRNQPSEDDR